MANGKQLSKIQVAWLRQEYPRVLLPRKHPRRLTYRELAQSLDCCVDTLKRLLVTYEIASFQSERFVPSRRNSIEMWTRPCSKCGCTKPRPKWKFYCSRCKANMDWLDED